MVALRDRDREAKDQILIMPACDEVTVKEGSTRGTTRLDFGKSGSIEVPTHLAMKLVSSQRHRDQIRQLALSGSARPFG